MRGGEHGEYVEMDHGVPLVGIALLDTGSGGALAGIGIDRVEPAEMLHCLRHRLVQLVARGHIAGQRERLLADVPGKVCQCIFRAREQRDVPARLCRSAGGGGADAGRGAGDEQRLGHGVSWFRMLLQQRSGRAEVPVRIVVPVLDSRRAAGYGVRTRGWQGETP